MTFALRQPRDVAFYGGLFVAWIAAVFLVHGRYQYFDRPIPASEFIENAGLQLRQAATLHQSIAALQKNAATELNVTEKGHTLHNIGLAYYDLYLLGHQVQWLDSVKYYFVRSIELVPRVSRFHYNFGRLMTEVENHQAARKEYIAALKIEPTHVLALHNLALLNYYELHQPDSAAAYLDRALAINPNLPICNYILGEISLDKKEVDRARDYFERELALAETRYGGGELPARTESIAYALSLTHIELAMLYSKFFPDRARAQQHVDAYLSLEHDPAKRTAAVQRIKQYWQTK